MRAFHEKEVRAVFNRMEIFLPFLVGFYAADDFQPILTFLFK